MIDEKETLEHLASVGGCKTCREITNTIAALWKVARTAQDICKHDTSGIWGISPLIESLAALEKL